MNTKLIVALVVVGVLAITIVGLAAAQISTSTPTPNGPTAKGTPLGGFFGWMGRCLGFRSAQYYGSQGPVYASQQPVNITVTNSNTGTSTTYQGYYGYGPCGGMLGRFFP